MAVGEISAGGTIIGGIIGQRGPQGIGIRSITKTDTQGLVDTYTITYTNNTTSTFEVVNGAKGDAGAKGDTGVSITDVSYSSSSGLVDTYIVSFSNGETSSFQVNNGKGILSIAYTSTSGLTDTYTITYNDNTTSTFTIVNGTTFIPSLDENGNLSWSNDGGKVNPPTRNIKGQKGDKGEQGIQGVQGIQGKPFRFAKVYSSVSAMQLDFANMEEGDIVLIATSVETEDNSKMYERGELEWVYLNDLSGATGIQGEQGVQGEQGIQGEKGDKGDTGESGNGIVSIEKTSTSGLVDTYTITYDNGGTDTLDITNGENGDVADVQVDGTSVVDNGIANIEGVNKLKHDVEMYKMLENALPKVEGEGESITLDGTAKSPMKLGFKGQIQQASTTGKNLCNITNISKEVDGVTFTINSDGSIKANGTSTAEINYFVTLPPYITLNPSKQYYLSGSPSTASSSTYRLMARCVKSDDSLDYVADNNGNGVAFVSDTKEGRVYINIKNGQTLNNVMFYPMLEEGSSKSDFEPYTGGSPSPSPDYPQDIHIVSGDNEIKVQNKNLFDKDNIEWKRNNASIYEMNNTDSNTGRIRSSSFSIQGGKTYTISGLPNGMSLVAIRTFNVPSGDSIGSATLSGNTFTLNDNVNYIHILLGGSNFTSETNELVKNANIQIELGSTATSYVEHKEYTKEINLPVENLFDKDNASYKNGYFINSSGVEQTTGQSGYTTSYVKVRPNTTYTLSGKIKPIDLVGGVYFYDNTKNWINRTNWMANTTENYFTFITPSNCYYIQFQYNLGEYNANTIQICEGNTKTYYPYGTTPVEVGGIGDYEDEFFKNTIDSEYYDSTLEQDKWYLKKRIGKVVLDGTETWSNTVNQVGTSNFYRFSCSDFQDTTKYMANTLYISDNFTYATNTLQEKNVIGNTITADLNRLYITIDTTLVGGTATSDFKNWLSTHNTLVYYILTTPENILLNDTLQETLDSFYSWQEQTNISQENNDLPFVIKASAIYDLSNLVTRVAVLESEG